MKATPYICLCGFGLFYSSVFVFLDLSDLRVMKKATEFCFFLFLMENYRKVKWYFTCSRYSHTAAPCRLFLRPY